MGNYFSKGKNNNSNKIRKNTLVNYKQRKYNINIDAVKVSFYDHSGNRIHDIKPKYSYIYKGVPGGWYV